MGCLQDEDRDWRIKVCVKPNSVYMKALFNIA